MIFLSIDEKVRNCLAVHHTIDRKYIFQSSFFMQPSGPHTVEDYGKFLLEFHPERLSPEDRILFGAQHDFRLKYSVPYSSDFQQEDTYQACRQCMYEAKQSIDCEEKKITAPRCSSPDNNTAKFAQRFVPEEPVPGHRIRTSRRHVRAKLSQYTTHQISI